MKKACTTWTIIVAAVFVLAAGAYSADFTAADIAGTWDTGGNTEYIIISNGVFTVKTKGPTGNINTTTGTFMITGGDRLQFKKQDGRPWLSYKIVSISSDKRRITVKMGTMVRTWSRK